MASSSSVTASSLPFSSSERRRKRYDVFISFRGEDTRCNFTSHLHAALCRKSIETYIDDRLHRGDVISEALIKAIEDSYVSLVVFSENYASSKWCLDELTKIVECKRLEEQVVIPVFYKIDPSHVRKQLWSYKSALARHEKDLKQKKDRVLKWKAALTEAANLAGYDSHSHSFRTDYELVEQIVKDVMRILNHIYPSKLRHLVGVEQNCVLIESLLTNNPSKVQIIGIWGMGGIGKTTLAAVLFAKLSSQYEGRCFLENVRTESKKHGLNFLHNKLLSKLLEEEDTHICTPQVASSFVLSRLNRRRSFIVLDDVNNSEQLEYLVGEHDYLGLGSRVIVTTRDKHVLSIGVDEIYEVKPLSSKDSLRLFSLNAFNKNNPEMQLEEQSTKVVSYAKGIPLVLKVLGSFLRSKSKKEWANALRKLQKVPNREIQNVLRLSFDELDDKDQEIFLDIACIFKGWDKDYVTRLLEGCHFYPEIGIKNLIDKALITISHHNIIEMHDLIQEMGCEIVRQESIKDAGSRSRLCDPEEIYDVLKNNKGTDAIEGIVLDAYQFRELCLAPDVFKKMSKLRVLKFNVGERGNIYLPSGLESVPDSLIYLNWWGCPLKSLPSTFCPEKLVKIRMQGSHVEKLWDGAQNLVSLEVIDLARSKHLLELPDLSKASNLEEIMLEQCRSLHEVHPSILSLPKLERINLFKCKSLKSLKNDVPSRSLKFVRVAGCSSLTEFSIMSTKIEEIGLWDTAIAKLPLSVLLRKGRDTYVFEPIESLGKIPKFAQTIRLTGCRVKSDSSVLRNTLESLRNLRLLDLDNSTFSELPKTINQLESLQTLSMVGSHVERLPANIKHLSHLRCLWLNGCKRLQCLPELPLSLLHLDARQCISLATVFTSTYDNEPSGAHGMAFFFFENCIKLGEDAVNSIVGEVQVRIKLAANGLFSGRTLEKDFVSRSYSFEEKDSQICFYLPGGKLPDWFRYCSTQPSLTFEIPLHSRFFGFAFSVIIAVAKSDAKDVLKNRSPGCECSFEAYSGETIKFESLFNHQKSHHLISDHVYLWYDAYCYDKMVDAIKNSPENFNPKFSFKFFIKAFEPRERRYIKMSSIVVSKNELMIKSCGVHPIYASKNLTIGEKGSIKSYRSLEIHELESLPKITRQVICPPHSSGSWKQNESKGLKEILF